MSTDNPVLEKMIPEMIEEIVKVTVDQKLHNEEIESKFKLLTPAYDLVYESFAMNHNKETQEEDLDKEICEILGETSSSNWERKDSTETDRTSDTSNYISANENIEKEPEIQQPEVYLPDVHVSDDLESENEEDKTCLKLFSSFEELNDNSIMKVLIS